MSRCFIDMDGVLANFVEGICLAHNRPNPYEDPTNYGIFDMEKIWGMSVKDFWAPTNQQGFWFGLSKMPDADKIVAQLTEKFGIDNLAILSAPNQSPYCIPEKNAWIRAYYPQLAKRVFFGSAKGFLSSPRYYLYDDRDRNIEEFNTEGEGIGILVPRLWNKGYRLIQEEVIV